jgi:ABC-type amino acid transport substrate-binding protein
MTRSHARGRLAAVVLAIALCLPAAIGCTRQPDTPQGASPTAESGFQRIKRTGIIRAAFGGFPPYTIVDPNPKAAVPVSGFAVDLIAEIAKRHDPPLRVEWGNVNWSRLRADMIGGRYDVLVDAVYETIPRASDFAFTEPFSYFGIACGLVRKDDNRFRAFADLDRPDITIALAAGYTSTEYARAHLTKPRFKEVPVGDTPFAQLDDVRFGRADVALNDTPTVVQYAQAHPDAVKPLWVDRPPSLVAAGLMLRKEDAELLAFLNSAIRILSIDGTIRDLDQKWNALGYYEPLELTPGRGLAQYLTPTGR